VSKKRKGQDALQILENMLQNSNTEEKILQVIREKYGEDIYRVLRRGEFVYTGELWLIVLSRYDYEEYIQLPGREFFIQIGDWQIKPWTGDISMFYRRRAVV